MNHPLVAQLASLPSSRPITRAVLALIIVLFATANLPWHLDNYDQAKQAFVAYEISHGGDLFYQHTPRGEVATKPPLAGWVSLPIYLGTDSWDLAWRLPGFLSALVLLWILMREGARLLPNEGAFLAACAFGLNLLTPRLVTLVRTDMLLTLFITLCGWLILKKIQSGSPWSPGEKWIFFGAMTAALFTKGPIHFAFLLPGMVAFLFLCPKPIRGAVWSGWWTWAIPLALFLAWGVAGLLTRPDFYEEVVVNEFFSRFDQSLKSHERQQPFWFYFPHVIHKFLPWSLLVIALPLFSANVRTAIRTRPDLLWLACWALGGLLFMTLVPSKRVDRIYPVIPPLCLLVVGMVSACQCGQRVRAWCGAAIAGAVLFTGVYFAGIIWIGTLEGNNAIVRFGRSSASLVEETGGGPMEIVAGKDEGLLIYAGAKSGITQFTHPHRAIRHWQNGQTRALIISRKRLNSSEIGDAIDLPPPTLESGTVASNEEYLLFINPTFREKPE